MSSRCRTAAAGGPSTANADDSGVRPVLCSGAMPEPRSRARRPRLHATGKLSFRRRVRAIREDPPGYIEGGDDPPALEEIVPRGFTRVEVEIGPGKGGFLLAATERRPDTFYLGIEAAPAYARLAAERLYQAGRRNAAVLVDNARLYLDDRVPPGRVARIHVYFPDPWPKRRHRKRRLFSAGAPEILGRALAPGGHLLFASDNAAYAGQVVAILGAGPWFTRDEEEERRLIEQGPGEGFSPTDFERKYLAGGRRIRRYAFRRTDRP